MANTIGVSDSYFSNVVLNADGSVSYTNTPTGLGGLPSQVTESSQMFRQYEIDLMVSRVLSNSHDGGISPLRALALNVAVQEGSITATQLQTWLAGSDNMAIGGMKGFTSHDYNPATSGTIPSTQQLVSSPTLMALSGSSTFATSIVQQTASQVAAAGSDMPTLSGNQLQMEKMYLAAFNRAPEKGGLDYWTSKLDAGHTLKDVGDTIFSLDIVKAIYPEAATNTSFVTSIYNNVFGKTPDSSGLAYWQAKMDNGEHRGELVMNMINAGLGTPMGTSGRDYIVNRLETAHHATQNQVKTNVELPVNYLLDMSKNVGVATAAIATYNQSIDDSMATPHTPVNHFPVTVVGVQTAAADLHFI